MDKAERPASNFAWPWRHLGDSIIATGFEGPAGARSSFFLGPNRCPETWSIPSQPVVLSLVLIVCLARSLTTQTLSEKIR